MKWEPGNLTLWIILGKERLFKNTLTAYHDFKNKEKSI